MYTQYVAAEADIDVLLGQEQSGSRLHKNISYKPDTDLLAHATK